MYSLNYEMLTVVIQQFRYSGEVHADILPQTPALKAGGSVVLVTQNGSVTSCMILSRNGQKLYHDSEAQRFLSKIGVLDWKLVPSSSSLPASYTRSASMTQLKQMASGNVNRFPRARPVSPMHMRSWPLLHRNVYSACDGVRSVEQIAKLLARPLNVIEQVISDLREIGVFE